MSVEPRTAGGAVSRYLRPLQLAAGRVRPLQFATGLVLAAELGHLAAVFQEWPEWVLRGAFQTAAAGLQGLLLAGLLTGPSRKTVRRGVVLNVVLPALWLVSRTIGIPSYVTFQRLPFGVVDLFTSAVEVAAAVLLVRELRAARRSG